MYIDPMEKDPRDRERYYDNQRRTKQRELFTARQVHQFTFLTRNRPTKRRSTAIRINDTYTLECHTCDYQYKTTNSIACEDKLLEHAGHDTWLTKGSEKC